MFLLNFWCSYEEQVSGRSQKIYVRTVNCEWYTENLNYLFCWHRMNRVWALSLSGPSHGSWAAGPCSCWCDPPRTWRRSPPCCSPLQKVRLENNEFVYPVFCIKLSFVLMDLNSPILILLGNSVTLLENIPSANSKLLMFIFIVYFFLFSSEWMFKTGGRNQQIISMSGYHIRFFSGIPRLVVLVVLSVLMYHLLKYSRNIPQSPDLSSAIIRPQQSCILQQSKIIPHIFAFLAF